MPQAIKVTEDNLGYIIAHGRANNMNLVDVKDNMEYHAEAFGTDIYMITDGSLEKRNVTYTEMTDADFNAYWKFVDGEDPNRFMDITPIKPR